MKIIKPDASLNDKARGRRAVEISFGNGSVPHLKTVDPVAIKAVKRYP